MKQIELSNFSISNDKELTIIGGMNVLESHSLAMQVAEHFKKVTEKLNINDKSTEIPIGVSCRTCDRLDCSQRAFPPLHKKFDVDINSRGVSVYVGDKN